MKLIQARVPDAEYQLLRRQARAEGKAMQEVVREALRERLLPDEVDPTDPLFRLFPLTSPTGKRHRRSEEHDDYLYGKRR